MRPFTMVFGLGGLGGLHMASQSSTLWIASVLKSSTRHQRWSDPLSGDFLQMGHGILSVGGWSSTVLEQIRFV